MWHNLYLCINKQSHNILLSNLIRKVQRNATTIPVSIKSVIFRFSSDIFLVVYRWCCCCCCCCGGCCMHAPNIGRRSKLIICGGRLLNVKSLLNCYMNLNVRRYTVYTIHHFIFLVSFSLESLWEWLHFRFCDHQYFFICFRLLSCMWWTFKIVNYAACYLYWSISSAYQRQQRR